MPLLLQDTSSVAAAAAEPTEINMTLFELLSKGGIVMIPILLLLVISIYLLIERMLYIRNRSKSDRLFMHNIKDMLHKGDLPAAKQFCERQQNAIGTILQSGIGSIGKSSLEIDSNLEMVTSHELSKMEKNLSYLGMIAGIAPMLGFVGTISGVIKIFYMISLSDNISIGIISGGLYEKMITSGTGLIVGIFAYVSYHVLMTMIDKFTLKTEEVLIDFKQTLQEPGV